MPDIFNVAEFIRLTSQLLALDRGQELHLFEGLPPQWLKPRMVTKLNGMGTVFGKLTMELKVAAGWQEGQPENRSAQRSQVPKGCGSSRRLGIDRCECRARTLPR